MRTYPHRTRKVVNFFHTENNYASNQLKGKDIP